MPNVKVNLLSCFFHISGGLQAIAELLQVDHDINGNTTEQYNITMRRYACMALTNLTFGDGTNKALLCSMKSCMRALVAQLHSPNEDLRQVAASVLRNLSWRADLASKKTLREVGAVTALMCASMEVKKESTLKSILSALWNLSAHCSENKADICAVDGALAFLVSTLTYKSPSKTLAIIENGGGILRNISSHIAVREDYRKVLRLHGCLQILLKHLRSPSLTIVSNACGTLWNLSARCPEDQKALWDMGAVSMLRNLVHSKHKMISMGSAAALKNLLAAKPAMVNFDMDRHTKSNMPSLHVRKQKALEAELDQNLAETCENVESPQGSPTETRKHIPAHDAPKYLYTSENCGIYQVADNEQHRRSLLRSHHMSRNPLSADTSPRSPVRSVSRSASQDSIGSVHSDISHDRTRVQNVLAKSSKLLQERQNLNLDRRRDLSLQRYNSGSEGQRSTTGSDSGIQDRSGRGNAPNSRIMQVMHEVAVHAGIDSGPFAKDQFPAHMQESQSAEGTPQSVRRSQHGNAEQREGRRGIPVFRGQQQQFRGQQRASDSQGEQRHGSGETLNNSSTQQAGDNRGVHYTNLTHRMENLHLNDDDGEHTDEEPINYSMKYSESPRSETGGQGPSAFVKPVPKIGNLVAGLIQSTPGVNQQQQAKKPKQQPATKQPNNMNNMNLEYSGYAETDLDNDDVDQPTNYSIRFAEHTDDGHFSDQPINYSTRYKEPEGSCVECKLEAQRCNEYVGHLEPDVDDDTLQTFYTEGTPLNYLSTATSMNDLSGKANLGARPGGIHKHGPISAAEARTGSMPVPSGPATKNTYSDSCASHSQNSTVVGRAKHVEAANIQNNNVPAVKDVSTTEQVNLYSYNDTNASASPSEKPTKYCTEGTPTSFSRVSSLSSLHSSEAQDHASPQSEPRSRDDIVLESIDENTSLEITASADVTLRQDNQDGSFTSANTTLGSQGAESTNSGPVKSVTFDDNNQVQETPLMFSRCSSLGSLSSFDAHSVHSSVVSEYSRRASEVVSPSDLPDSPSDTMPPSPTHRKSPIKFLGTEEEDDEDKENEADITQIENVQPPKADHEVSDKEQQENSVQQAASQKVNESQVFRDSIVSFAEDTSPPGFSCNSSLSCLTFDDEAHIKKDTNLRRVPLGQEDDSDEPAMVRNEMEETMIPVEPTSPIAKVVEDDDDDDLSVSEGEEDMLAACINLAMPNNSRKKMKRSTSDSFLKKKAGFTKINNLGVVATSTPVGKSRLPSKVSNVATVAPMSPQAGMPFSPRMNASYHGSVSHHEDLFGGSDTPKKFETEGTPLNFSNAGSLGGSLSDLSVGYEDKHDDGDGESDAYLRTPNLGAQQKLPTPHSTERPASDADDAKSDVSSLSEDGEDLLSEAIEAAMPKNKKEKKMDRMAEGSDTKAKARFHIPSFKPKKSAFEPQRTSSQSGPPPGTINLPTDTVRTYATEGTPLNFSTANSLSDLSCDDPTLEEKKERKLLEEEEEDTVDVLPPPPAYQDDSVFSNVPGSTAYDSPHVFGIEGTPVSFSRNDSLSSLSCDEDADLQDDKDQLKREVKGPRGHVSPGGSITPPTKGLLSPKGRLMQNRRVGQLTGSVSPGSAKGKVTSRAQRSLHYSQEGPQTQSQTSPPHSELSDQPHVYAVEGTPNCFSRNSSLSSLNSDDHEGLAQRNSGSGSNENSPEPAKDQGAAYKVEGTPRAFSRNSSLSSLSVESLSFEPTPSEKALLEECINAAMPKNKPSKKKKSPTGSAPRMPKMKGSKSEESNLSAQNNEEQPKNVLASQSKNESITEESRGPNDATSLIVRRSASEGSKTRFGWRRSPTQDADGTKQFKEVYNQEQVLGSNVAAGGATYNVSSGAQKHSKAAHRRKEYDEKIKGLKKGFQNLTLKDSDDVIHLVYDVRQDKTPVDSEDVIHMTHSESNDMIKKHVHLGEQNGHLHNVYMEMPSCAFEGEWNRYEDKEPSAETHSKEQKSVGLNEKDHCSEPSENGEEVDHASTDSHSADELIVDKEEVEPTKENDSFHNEHSLDDSNLGCGTLLDIGDELDLDFLDITAETFPDMGVSLISINSPDEEQLPSFPEGSRTIQDEASEARGSDEPPTELESTSEKEETPTESSEDSTFVGDAELPGPDLEMSPEQERALEENASIIVSELSLTRHLSSSTLDEDAFIENETISLVSNDCTSDTASEVSVALSSSSKTMSEQASEASTMSEHSSPRSIAPKSPGRARIVKPLLTRLRGAPPPKQEKDTDKGPKPVRGKRRSLFSRAKPAPQKSPSPPPEKVIRGGPSKGPSPIATKSKVPPSKTAGPGAKASAKVLPKPRTITPPRPGAQPKPGITSLKGAPTKSTPPKTPPRGSSLRPSTSTNSRTSSPQTAAATKAPGSSPKTPRNAKVATPIRTSSLSKISSKTDTGISRSGGKTGKGGVECRLKSPKSSPAMLERPPPPIKQGTFTKDEPSQNAPEITAENSDKRASACSQGSNRSSAELKYSNESQEKLAGTNGMPKGNSDGTSPQWPGSWSKSQGEQSDVVTRKNNSTGNVTKTASNGSLSKATGVSKAASSGNVSKTGSMASVSKSSPGGRPGGKSPLTRTSSGPTMTKKTSAVSPIRKTPSNNSLSKTPPALSSSKNSLKKSESQASLGQKTGLANGRPSTPPTRKLSGGSTPSPGAKNSASPTSTSTNFKKPQLPVGKKPAVSKIAGLWRKEESQSDKSPKSDKKFLSKLPGAQSKSPKAGRRSLLSVVKPNTDKSKKAEADGAKVRELTRSSTYDKLPMPDDLEDGEGATGGEEVSGQPNAGTKKQWRRTYTIDSEDETSCPVESSHSPELQSLSSGVSASQQDKSKVSTQQLKKSSIWRRNAADSDTIRKEPAAESKQQSPKKSGLWKRTPQETVTSNGVNNDAGSPAKSKLPTPGGDGVWMKRGGSLIPSPAAKASDKKVANGHVPNGQSKAIGDGKNNANIPQPITLISPSSDDKPLTVSSPKGELNAAIVPPYNYNPNQTSTSSISKASSSTPNGTANTGKQLNELAFKTNSPVGFGPCSSKSSIPSSPTKPLTKTEMLIARRRQSYLNSRNKEEHSNEEDDAKRSACLVTTV